MELYRIMMFLEEGMPCFLPFTISYYMEFLPNDSYKISFILLLQRH